MPVADFIDLTAFSERWRRKEKILFTVQVHLTGVGSDHLPYQSSFTHENVRCTFHWTGSCTVDTQSLYDVPRKKGRIMGESDILQPNINNAAHFKAFFPSWENNIILPVACLTGCSRADRHAGTAKKCISVCVYECGRERARLTCHFLF